MGPIGPGFVAVVPGIEPAGSHFVAVVPGIVHAANFVTVTKLAAPENDRSPEPLPHHGRLRRSNGREPPGLCLEQRAMTPAVLDVSGRDGKREPSGADALPDRDAQVEISTMASGWTNPNPTRIVALIADLSDVKNTERSTSSFVSFRIAMMTRSFGMPHTVPTVTAGDT